VDFLECNYLEEIVKVLDKQNPQFLIVDSIQVVRSLERDLSPNSQSLITYICDTLTEVVKRKNITCILIGHVTKEGEIAGPKILEHLVDVVLYFQGDRDGQYRFLKSLKNRFGSTHEVGLFKMETSGLQEISDPTKEFVSIRDKEVSGVALSCIMEGTRPIIVEIQALCVKTSFGYAKRSCVGFDINRLNMILAVLQKYYSVDLSEQDVYVNVTGGLKIKDTACDLAVMHALKASYLKESHKMDKVYIGEVGLTGEIKKPSFSDIRKAECQRLGFGISSLI
jgi:DNA repair protein RadA/Sms